MPCWRHTGQTQPEPILPPGLVGKMLDVAKQESRLARMVTLYQEEAGVQGKNSDYTILGEIQVGVCRDPARLGEHSSSPPLDTPLHTSVGVSQGVCLPRFLW